MQRAGRQITVRKWSQTADDTDKPWGPDADFKSSPEKEVSLWAAPVHPTDLNILGTRIRDNDLMKNTRKWYIATPGSEILDDFSEFQEVQDGTEVFKITFLEELRPGSLTVLWYIGAGE